MRYFSNNSKNIGILPFYGAFLLAGSESLPNSLKETIMEEYELKRKKAMSRKIKSLNRLYQDMYLNQESVNSELLSKKCSRNSLRTHLSSTTILASSLSLPNKELSPNTILNKSNFTNSITCLHTLSDRFQCPERLEMSQIDINCQGQPKFMYISKNDALYSNMTVFIITKLCDGDLDDLIKANIPEEQRTWFISSLALSIGKTVACIPHP